MIFYMQGLPLWEENIIFSNPDTKTKKAKLWGFCSFLDVDRTPLKVLSLFLYLSENFILFRLKAYLCDFILGVTLINFVPSLWLKIDLVFFWIVKEESLGIAQNVKLCFVSGLSRTKKMRQSCLGKKITRRTIGAKGFNLLQERLRCKGRQIYISVLNQTHLPKCLDNFQDFFQLF